MAVTEELSVFYKDNHCYMGGMTNKEMMLVRALRERSIDFGRIICIVYYQEGLIDRVELEKVIESIR